MKSLGSHDPTTESTLSKVPLVRGRIFTLFFLSFFLPCRDDVFLPSLPFVDDDDDDDDDVDDDDDDNDDINILTLATS